MTQPPCPKCGRQTERATTCPGCGQDLASARQVEAPGALAQPAPTEAGAANGKLPPELLEWARRTFDIDEFMAGVREIRETGGLQFEDFIEELERAAGEHE